MTCIAACRRLSPRHHAVIYTFVYGVRDEKRRHTKVSAWKAHYPKASSATASSKAGHLFATPDGDDCYRHHMAEMEAATQDDWSDIRARLVASAKANALEFFVAREADDEAVRRLVEGIEKGKRKRTRKGDTWVKLSDAELMRRINAAASYRAKAPHELTPAQRSVIVSFKYDPSRGTIEYRIDRMKAASLLADIDGKKSLTLNLKQADSIARRPLRRLEQALKSALDAAVSGDAEKWVKATAESLAPDPDFEKLAANPSGSAEAVYACVLGLLGN